MNVKWHSDPWPTVTSQPIRLSTNFMTLIPSLTLTDYEWFPWSICNGCGMPAGNAYPSGHLVPSPTLGLANAPIVATIFLELAMSLLDFSPRIPLGTFSILLATAPLTCSERGGSENICLQRDSNPHHASPRQESQRLRPLGREGLMAISGFMSYRIIWYKLKKNLLRDNACQLDYGYMCIWTEFRLNFHFLSHCRF